MTLPTVGFSVSLMFASVTVDNTTACSMGVVASVACGAWWVGKKIQAIEDRFRWGEKQFDRIDQMLLKMEKQIEMLGSFTRGGPRVEQSRMDDKHIL